MIATLAARTTATANPYVGPRAFTTGEQLYGRERESRALLNMLIADRIVLLYSPSGAGKTSLVQAALIPTLQQEQFSVLPVMRVSLRPPHPVARGVAGGATTPNRFILSLLFSLEAQLPEEEQLPLGQLADMDLATYLQRRRKVAGVNEGAKEQVLIFDQFEEILLIDPVDLAAKRQFFEQVGQVLHDRSRWALFAMREEYVAGLDPYRPLLPTRLGTTYRLDLLGEAAARQAIQKPARQAGVDFTDDAARKLVDDLRRVQVQRPDGSSEQQLGPYVEPVQLQVVCRGIWDKLSPTATQIVESDIGGTGDVDTALADYYAERVATIAEQTGVSERQIRDWIENELITAQEIRGQVLLVPGASQGLANKAIWALVDSHLVRAEQRRGATWFELAHDRLIEPVKKNNAAWREARFSPLQRQAALWESQNQPAGLLMRGAELAEAGRWAAMHQDGLSPSDKQFLAVSEATQRTRQRNLLLRGLAAGLFVVALVLTVLTIFSAIAANDQRKIAEGQRRIALSRQLDAQALNYADTKLDLALLLNLEAYNEAYNVANTLETKGGLLDTLVSQRQAATVLRGQSSPVYSVAFSPDGKILASGDYDKSIILWDVNAHRALGPPLTGHAEPVRSVAFSPDGKILASGSDDYSIILWDVADSSNPKRIGQSLLQHNGPVRSVAFSPNGKILASGSDDNTIILWDMADSSSPKPIDQPLTGHAGSVQSVAFSSDGKILASGSDDKSIMLWDVENRKPRSHLTGHKDSVLSVAFSPHGNLLASGSDDRSVILWDLGDVGDVANSGSPKRIGQPLTGHRRSVRSVAFSPDGHLLASGSDDKSIILWDVSDPNNAQPIGEPLIAQNDSVWSVTFSQDYKMGRLLASGSFDGAIILWDVDNQQSIGMPLIGHSNAVKGIAFSPNGNLLASGSDDKSIILRDAGNPQSLTQTFTLTLTTNSDRMRSVAFSPDGKLLASGSRDNGKGVIAMALWDVKSHQPIFQPLTATCGWVRSVAFSPDGKLLASGSDDSNGVKLRNVANPEEPTGIDLPLNAHVAPVLSVAFSPVNKETGQAILASGSKDNTIILWDVAGRKPVTPSLTAHTAPVLSVAFSPDGKLLASGSDDKSVILWDLESHNLISQLTEHKAPVRSVAFSPDGKMLASGSDDSTIILWNVSDPNNPKRIGQPLTGHAAPVLSVAFSPDGKGLASSSADGTIILWKVDDPNSPKPIGQPITVHGGIPWSVAFSPDGRTLAASNADTDNSVTLWDVSDSNNPKRIGQPLTGHTAPVLSVAFSPDGKTLASGSENNTVILWEVDNHKRIGKPLTTQCGTVFSVAFSPDGKVLASGDNDNKIILWDVDDPNKVKPIGEPLAAHGDTVESVAFSPDGKTLASGSDDDTIILWDVHEPSNPKPIGQPLKAHRDNVLSVAFSPDGKLLASGSDDHTIILWDVADRKPIGRPLTAHTNSVRSVAFSPDGKTLASGSDDYHIILWDVGDPNNPKPIGRPFTVGDSSIRSLAFSPDGKTLASGSEDGIVILWDVDLQSWLDRACRIANRNLTPEEWHQYLGDEPYRKTCSKLP